MPGLVDRVLRLPRLPLARVAARGDTMSIRRKPSDVLDPPSDPIWLPLIDALEKYAWPRGPVSGDFVDNEHRRHFQSLCAVRRLHPSEPLHDDVRWLWDAGVADFLRQLEEGQLEGEGSPRIPYSDKIKIPADTWLAVRRTPLIDIDWERSIVFPKPRQNSPRCSGRPGRRLLSQGRLGHAIRCGRRSICRSAERT